MPIYEEIETQVEAMMDKYKQQEEVNADLLRQIELLEEQGDTAAFAEEMKRIYSDRDSYGAGPKGLSQSDRMRAAKSRLAMSAQKFGVGKPRLSNALPQVSEELDGEDDENSLSRDLGSGSVNSSRTGNTGNSLASSQVNKVTSSIDDFMDAVEFT